MSIKNILQIHPSGRETHITANQAAELLTAGNYRYEGHRDGKPIVAFHDPGKVYYWNGSASNFDKRGERRVNMFKPGEVIS